MLDTYLLPTCYQNVPVVEPKNLPAISLYSEVVGEKIAFWYGAPEPHKFSEHRHDVYQLTILPSEDTEGEISWRTAENKRKTCYFRGSQILYIGRQVPHSITLQAKFPIIHLYPGEKFVEKYAPEYLQQGIAIKKWWDAVRADLHVWFTTSVIVDSCQPLRIREPGSLELAAMFLASNLLMQGKAYCRQSTSRSLSTFQLRKVIDFVNDNFRKPIVVEDLAQTAGLGKDRFAHLFKATTGRTPHFYLLSVRIHHAQQLLRRNSHMTLAQVAVESGFFDQSHFGRSLRKFCEKHERMLRDYTI